MASVQLKVLIFLLMCFCMLKINVNCDEVWAWHWDKYPNLTSSQAKFCTGHLRNPPTAICDPDYVLSLYEVEKLDELIGHVDNKTKCLCDSCPLHQFGLNIKVALVKHLEILTNNTLENVVKRFSEHTRRRWNYGGDCYNDVLIFVAAYDDYVYVSMGSRAKDVIPLDLQNKILEETRAHFTSGNYYQGLESIIASFQDSALKWEPDSPTKLGFIAILGIVIGSIVIILALLIGVWFFIKRDKGSLSGSFEFIGTWGKNRQNKNKSHPLQTKQSPIYSPVKTEESKEPVV